MPAVAQTPTRRRLVLLAVAADPLDRVERDEVDVRGIEQHEPQREVVPDDVVQEREHALRVARARQRALRHAAGHVEPADHLHVRIEQQILVVALAGVDAVRERRLVLDRRALVPQAEALERAARDRRVAAHQALDVLLDVGARVDALPLEDVERQHVAARALEVRRTACSSPSSTKRPVTPRHFGSAKFASWRRSQSRLAGRSSSSMNTNSSPRAARTPALRAPGPPSGANRRMRTRGSRASDSTSASSAAGRMRALLDDDDLEAVVILREQRLRAARRARASRLYERTITDTRGRAPMCAFSPADRTACPSSVPRATYRPHLFGFPRDVRNSTPRENRAISGLPHALRLVRALPCPAGASLIAACGSRRAEPDRAGGRRLRSCLRAAVRDARRTHLVPAAHRRHEPRDLRGRRRRHRRRSAAAAASSCRVTRRRRAWCRWSTNIDDDVHVVDRRQDRAPAALDRRGAQSPTVQCVEGADARLYERKGDQVPVEVVFARQAAAVEMQKLSMPEVWDYNALVIAFRAWERKTGSTVTTEVMRSTLSVACNGHRARRGERRDRARRLPRRCASMACPIGCAATARAMSARPSATSRSGSATTMAACRCRASRRATTATSR